MGFRPNQRQLPQRYQNQMNNAQGHIFEDAILCGCAWYRRAGLAEIDKTPEPFRVMAKLKDGIFKGRFTARAQPDFQGTIIGGRSIVFEAKYTTTDRLRRDVLTEKQMEALEQHLKMGAHAFVCAGIRDKHFFIPWELWRDMKKQWGRQYVTAEDLKLYQVKFNGAVMFLDYIREWIFPPIMELEMADNFKRAKLPLTLDELMQIDGEPVWNKSGECFLVDVHHKVWSGQEEPCGVNQHGQASSLALLEECGVYRYRTGEVYTK